VLDQAPPDTITPPRRPGALAALWGMGSCYWSAAALSAAVAWLLIAVPTALVTNPVFGRTVATRPVDHVVAVVSALLIGMIWAARRAPTPDATGADTPDPARLDPADERARRRSAVGGLIALFAVGCPVCNKLVLVALGSSGALSWWAPLQPVLGLLAVGVLAVTLRTQLRQVGSLGCARPS
jgi:hypothetical protein